MVSMSFGRSGAGPSKSAADREDRYLGWLFILPALLVIVTFIVGPIIYAAWVSLHDWDTVGNFGHPETPRFQDFGEVVLRSSASELVLRSKSASALACCNAFSCCAVSSSLCFCSCVWDSAAKLLY